MISAVVALAELTAYSTSAEQRGGSLVYDIFGDGSYLALVDMHRYQSFSGKDWVSNERLLEPHFIEQMQKHALLVWDTGFETDWRVEVRDGFSQERGFRDVLGSLLVSEGEAFILNYDSLSMAADYEDYQLPDKASATNRIVLKAGTYDCRIVQMVDPEQYFASDLSQAGDRPPEFLIELEPAHKMHAPWSNVPWSKL